MVETRLRREDLNGTWYEEIKQNKDNKCKSISEEQERRKGRIERIRRVNSADVVREFRESPGGLMVDEKSLSGVMVTKKLLKGE